MSENVSGFTNPGIFEVCKQDALAVPALVEAAA